MARKVFCVPALVTAVIAILLLLLTVISLPTTYHKSTLLDIVRAHNLAGAKDLLSDNRDGLNKARFGLWGYCTEALDSDRYGECTNPLHYSYGVTFATSGAADGTDYKTASVTQTYTRGLAIVVVAFFAAVVAFVLSFFPILVMEFIASLVYLLATVIAFIAFIVQVAFYVHVRTQLRKVAPSASAIPGTAFYFTLVSIPLLLFSALTVCYGHRSGRRDIDGIDNVEQDVESPKRLPKPRRSLRERLNVLGTKM